MQVHFTVCILSALQEPYCTYGIRPVYPAGALTPPGQHMLSPGTRR